MNVYLVKVTMVHDEDVKVNCFEPIRASSTENVIFREANDF